MKLLYRLTVLMIVLSGLNWWTSCDVGGSGSEDDTSYERGAMLENYGEDIITPSYAALQDSIDRLEAAADSFSADPTIPRLQTLQKTLKGARLGWQRVNLYSFGPAESRVLRTSINTYPTDTSRIENNIDSGDYTLGSVSNQNAAGFPALGYLLHGVGDNAEQIISAYQDASDASGRMNYLLDNVNYIAGQTDAVVSAWQPEEGTYMEMFLSEENAGTDAGSSLGMVVNAMVQHYERFLRDGKIGIPSGVRSAGVPRPQATEAYYSGYSRELAVKNLETVKRFFKGREFASGNDGPGLEENLQALGAEDLSRQITTELDTAITSVESLNDPLSQQIENNNDPVQAAFTDIQELVALFKADMTSVLGVTITYQDNDGD